MNKTEREMWDSWIEEEYAKKETPAQQSLIIAADVYIRKLERELQALKNKKSMAALLMKKA